MKLPGAREGLALVIAFAGIVSATSGEVWMCTFPGLISTMTVKERFRSSRSRCAAGRDDDLPHY